MQSKNSGVIQHSTFLIFAKINYPEYSFSNNLLSFLKILCYCPDKSKNADNEAGQPSQNQEIDHFKHFRHNLRFLEEEDILESGEYIFLWLKFEEEYQTLDFKTFSEVELGC